MTGTFEAMDKDFDRIADFLKEKSRLSFTGHKRSVLRQRLEGRLQQLMMPDFSAYWKFLLGNPGEVVDLFNLVTTNETSFFRNCAQFDYLKNSIIRQLESRATPENRRIRILSAGCSSGEEPYSIAMTLLDALQNHDDWSLEIVAGDLSDNCLQEARKGYYEDNKLVKLPGGYRERFMISDSDGAVVQERIKKIVRFTRLNLDELMKSECPFWSQGLGAFDIIFCRNVMIYFASSCQQQLVDTLYRLLLPGGFLFTGDAEPLHLFKHEFLPVAAAGCLIYQKRGENNL